MVPAGPADLVAAIVEGGADAVLAASIFHRRIHSIAEVKAALARRGPLGPAHARGRRMTTGSSRPDPSAGHPTPSDADAILAAVRFDRRDGLLTAVVQDASDGRLLMVAHMDAEALAATLETGEVHLHSRSRDRLWRKGETSGNVLRLRGTEVDCDGDAVLLAVEPMGPTCHRGTRTCFDPAADELPGAEVDREAETFASGADQGFAWLEELWTTLLERAARRPSGSYTATLLEGGVDAVGRKVTEEATEVLLAAKDDATAQAGRHGSARARSAPSRARRPTCSTTCSSSSRSATSRRHG